MTIRVSVRRAWKRALLDVAVSHRSKFDAFLDNFLDTILHEFAHAFGPANLDTTRSERMAQTFAMYGRWTRF